MNRSSTEVSGAGLVDSVTRFLWPFVFKAGAERQAVTILKSQNFATTKASHALWETATPLPQYTDGLSSLVDSYLFPEEGERGCAYLRLTAVANQAWFDGLEATHGGDSRPMPCQLVKEAGVELFLTGDGAGVLSLTLAPNIKQPSQHQVRWFNYHLAHLRQAPLMLRKPHPKEDPTRWASMPEEFQATIETDVPMLDAPSLEALPLAERLSRPGAGFHLEEFFDFLLGPLKPLGARPIQSEVAIFTVIRLGSAIDFGGSASREAFAPLLSTLAFVEEPNHPGATFGTLLVPNAILNRKHWAATSQLGAVQLVADQPAGEADGGFNAERFPVLRDRYFIPFLLALIQRTVLARFSEEASAILRAGASDTEQRLYILQRGALQFSGGGQFTQVSSQDALQRFYSLARQGLDVLGAWQEVRHWVTDVQATDTGQRLSTISVRTDEGANRQQRLLENSERESEAAVRTRVLVEALTVVVVAIAFAQLCSLVLPATMPHAGLVTALFGWLGAVASCFAVIEPPARWKALAIATLIFAVAGGLSFFAEAKPQPAAASVPAAASTNVP